MSDNPIPDNETLWRRTSTGRIWRVIGHTIGNDIQMILKPVDGKSGQLWVLLKNFYKKFEEAE